MQDVTKRLPVLHILVIFTQQFQHPGLSQLTLRRFCFFITNIFQILTASSFSPSLSTNNAHTLNNSQISHREPSTDFHEHISRRSIALFNAIKAESRSPSWIKDSATRVSNTLRIPPRFSFTNPAPQYLPSLFVIPQPGISLGYLNPVTSKPT